MSTRRQPQAIQKNRWLIAAVLTVAGVGVAVWWISGPDLATETIVLQQQLLDEATDPAACKRQLRQIMQNIDQLPTEEIHKVRQELGRAVSGLTKQAAERYLQASPAERPELLDADLGRLQLVLALFDATNQGGMRVRTQADVDRAEERRKSRTQAVAKRPPATAKPPVKQPAAKKPRPAATPTQVYAQALLKHAEKKGIDLGRFGRRLGRG